MLIGINGIKEKLKDLSSISSNVSSILSKVNSLGSQKQYSFSGEGYIFSGASAKSFSGDGLLILVMQSNSSSQITVNYYSIFTPTSSVISIPCKDGVIINSNNATIFGIQALWCPYQ